MFSELSKIVQSNVNTSNMLTSLDMKIDCKNSLSYQKPYSGTWSIVSLVLGKDSVLL